MLGNAVPAPVSSSLVPALGRRGPGQHPEVADGSFGMITAFVQVTALVQDPSAAASQRETGTTVVVVANAAGSTALTCRVRTT
ncbi:MAG: hypothetical protein V4515_08860 [Chloroflexota bacterium]